MMNHLVKDLEQVIAIYAIKDDVDEKLSYAVEYELIPLLKEYWFDDSDKVEYWSNQLRSVINDSF